MPTVFNSLMNPAQGEELSLFVTVCSCRMQHSLLSDKKEIDISPSPVFSPSLPTVLHRARLLIVMEMMEGGELFHRISQHRHFTEKMASQVTKQVGKVI